MKRGLDQTLAWILATIFASGVYLAIHFSLSLSKKSSPEKSELTFDKGQISKEPDEHDPRFAGDSHGNSSEKAHHDAHGDSSAHDSIESHSAESHSGATGHHEKSPEKGSPSGHGEAHWEYNGPKGPEHWGEMDEKFSTCSSGREQSPINLTKAVSKNSLPRLNFHYRASKMRLVHNGHTVQANAEDAGSLDYDGDTYQLAQFHIHTPSEHRIDGVPSELEIHFVHRNEQRQLLVVGMMIDGGSKEFKPIAPLLARLPKSAGEEGSEASVDVTHFLPKNLNFFQYAGSLTTPPCSEGVKWFVLKQRQHFSDSQVDSLIKVLRFNSRPLQRVDGRVVNVVDR
jgi:carbonic anhydrase